MVHPQINGLWVKQDEQYGGYVLYEHSTESLFLYKKEGGSRYWMISAVLEGDPKFYFSNSNSDEPPEYWFVSKTREKGQFDITYGDPTGESYNCV